MGYSYVDIKNIIKPSISGRNHDIKILT
jgi:hypothetical protein